MHYKSKVYSKGVLITYNLNHIALDTKENQERYDMSGPCPQGDYNPVRKGRYVHKRVYNWVSKRWINIKCLGIRWKWK